MKTIAVIFGGQSTEHDVSIITALASVIKPFELTNEFNIDATALSISVSAIANKKAGKKEPINPESPIHFHWRLSD